MTPDTRMLGLYLHVPFCSAICGYCTFTRGLFDPALKARYVAALEAEIARAEPGPADTIFFGGGTPSLLDPADVARLIDACAARFALAPGAEITLEGNPESVSEAKLRAYRTAGVTRLSLGAQSFHDDELRRLDRLHAASRIVEAVGEARAAGFDNVSLDLMYWLPGQTLDTWLQTVDRAIATGPEHVSFYLLELYPNAPLRDAVAREGWSMAPDEDAAAMFLEGLARLDAAGYDQYEISNAARPGREARHNLKYWTDGEWVGFGCGAHSTRGAARWRNVPGAADYVDRVAAGTDPAAERQVRTPGERLGDALFMGLRLARGIDVSAVGARYGTDVMARFGRDVAPFVDADLLRVEGSRLRLTRQGMLVASEVMQVFV